MKGRKKGVVIAVITGLLAGVSVYAKRQNNDRDTGGGYFYPDVCQGRENTSRRQPDCQGRKNTSRRQPHVRQVRENNGHRLSFYERRGKRMMDQVLSFVGLVTLAPVFILIGLAVFLDDPGPVFFTQRRVGKNKTYFLLHKFRSMKTSAPHEIPTHMLSAPEQYLTRTGRFLRRYSLDELPQLWDVFAGNMSLTGPRPALWNQEDLVAERDRYGANDVLPGLTGWAQIYGRDELGIKEKAALDGQYVRRLREGGCLAFLTDLFCIVRTVSCAVCAQGVVEGGTGKQSRYRKNRE